MSCSFGKVFQLHAQLNKDLLTSTFFFLQCKLTCKLRRNQVQQSCELIRNYDFPTEVAYCLC